MPIFLFFVLTVIRLFGATLLFSLFLFLREFFKAFLHFKFKLAEFIISFAKFFVSDDFNTLFMFILFMFFRIIAKLWVVFNYYFAFAYLFCISINDNRFYTFIDCLDFNFLDFKFLFSHNILSCFNLFTFFLLFTFFITYCRHYRNCTANK